MGFFAKKIRMLLLHDHSNHMVILGPFQSQFKNNYLHSFFLSTNMDIYIINMCLFMSMKCILIKIKIDIWHKYIKKYEKI